MMRRQGRSAAGRLLLAITLASALFAGAHAVEPDEVLADPVLEARARALSKTLRCMVCQNQSIDDSNAPLARDLRILVRERLVAGDSDGAVRAFLVARYGEFVLLQPAVSSRTILLWATPGIVLMLGAVVLVLALRRRAAEPAPLDAVEARKLATLTDGSAPSEKET